MVQFIIPYPIFYTLSERLQTCAHWAHIEQRPTAKITFAAGPFNVYNVSVKSDKV